MASKLKFIKKLNDPDIINYNQLYFNFIFGGKAPQIYDENKIYNTGDIILKKNEYDVYDIYVCKEDNVTGPFNIDLWQKVSLTEIIKNGDIINGGGGGRDLILVQDTQPDNKHNKIWLQPKHEYMVDSELIK